MCAKIRQETPSFTLYEVYEGVYAAIDKNKQTGSNAGIIDLGGVSVIYDTFLNIDAARELQRLCLALTGREAAFVVNSHSHTDHIVGNSLFRDATIISSKATQAQIEKSRDEFEKEKATYPSEIESVRAGLSTATDETQSADLKNALLYLTNLAKPGVEIKAPNMAFDGELILCGTARSLHLTSYEAAHSRGDVIAHVSDTPVCFMGDLLFTGTHPWLGSGDPEKFLEVLDGIRYLAMEHFIPGHGPLAGEEDICMEMQYIKEMLELVKSRKSTDERDYALSDLSAEFHHWISLCFSWNIKFLIGREQNKV